MRLDEKYKLVGNFEKVLKIVDKNAIEKLNFKLFWESSRVIFQKIA